MCVIFSTFGIDPSKELLEEGARRNTDGAGVAWLDNGGAVVRWKKGITDVGEVIEMVKAGLPHPYMIHFRKKSVGEADPTLTHPFPLDPDVPVSLEGSTPNGVLAHNGTWFRWEAECRPAIFGLGRRLPGGLWNDSRMLAYIAAHYGPHALQFLDWGQTGKIGILFPHYERVVHYNSREWTKKEGFWMSADLEKSIITVGESVYDHDSWPGGHHFQGRRFDLSSSSRVLRPPKPCPKCGTEGDVNYNKIGYQWCMKCREFFSESQPLLTGGGSGGSEKKASTTPTSEEVVISKMHLHRIVADMIKREWWMPPTPRRAN